MKMSDIVNLEVTKGKRGRPTNTSFDKHIEEALTLPQGKAIVVEKSLVNTLMSPPQSINRRIQMLGHKGIIKAFKQGDDIIIAKI